MTDQSSRGSSGNQLSELPLAIRVTHRHTLGLFHMLVLNGAKEVIEEACGEQARAYRSSPAASR